MSVAYKVLLTKKRVSKCVLSVRERHSSPDDDQPGMDSNLAKTLCPVTDAPTDWTIRPKRLDSSAR